MPRFKVVAGTHVQGGAKYHAGDTVESEANLMKVFPQKFVLTNDPAPSPTPTPPAPPAPAPNRVAPADGVEEADTEVEAAPRRRRVR